MQQQSHDVQDLFFFDASLGKKKHRFALELPILGSARHGPFPADWVSRAREALKELSMWSQLVDGRVLVFGASSPSPDVDESLVTGLLFYPVADEDEEGEDDAALAICFLDHIPWYLGERFLMELEGALDPDFVVTTYPVRLTAADVQEPGKGNAIAVLVTEEEHDTDDGEE